jgi:hypothetical protein
MVFGPSRRVARRTARRTTRRVARRQDAMSGAYDEPEEYYDDEPAEAPQQDYTQELEKLNQLKTQGIITEEEFQAKKAQILGI